ncbi:hypothetical protein ACROYT_G039154 [Oculina patagonica]
MNEAVSLYSSYIANCVFNAFSSYTAIMLNILTIHAIRRTPSLPKPLKTLLLSLAVSDLGVGLLVQPLYIAVMVKQLQQNTEDSSFHSTHTAFVAITVLFGYTSFFVIVAISADRFLAIHLHLRYQELVTHKRVVAVVILIWVLSAVLSLPGHWISDITKTEFTDHLSLYTLTLMFLNSSLNPVIYCWKMRHIRQAIMGILRTTFPRRNQTELQ